MCFSGKLWDEEYKRLLPVILGMPMICCKLDGVCTSLFVMLHNLWNVAMCVCDEAGGEKELPLSYLFVDDDDSSGSDATALIYKLHTSDNIKFVEHSFV